MRAQKIQNRFVTILKKPVKTPKTQIKTPKTQIKTPRRLDTILRCNAL
jgi:hypothetical protein